jgi:uncharacterized membrane protein SpoIIM required for sporulation
MNINQFISERKDDWDRLEQIAGKIKPGSTRGLSRDELWDLGRLYSAAVADLSLLKSSELARHHDSEIVAYLNALVIRVHGAIYRKPPFRWSSIPRFILSDFPAAFRASVGYVVAALLIFVLFGAIGGALGITEPEFIHLLVPQGIISSVEKGEVWFRDLHTVAPLASSRLMTHNISVTFLIVAGGMTFGVGTVYLLALNGLLVGTVAALCYNHGLSLEFWSFLLPHGSVELTAIFVAGGAGLILGHALVDPGPYRRIEYLSYRGKAAGTLALGCVPLLVVAGLIEAFVSPSSLPAWVKIVFGVAMTGSLWSFLLFSRKGALQADPSSSAEISATFMMRKIGARANFS